MQPPVSGSSGTTGAYFPAIAIGCATDAAAASRGDADGVTHTAYSTTQLAYAAAIAVAMIIAGLGKRRLEWKRRPRKRR
jgi:hypothetical protein